MNLLLWDVPVLKKKGLNIKDSKEDSERLRRKKSTEEHKQNK